MDLSSPLSLALRLGVPVLLALATAFLVDRMSRRKGFDPPGFDEPWRRGAAFAVLAAIFGFGLFAPLGMIGMEKPPIDPAQVSSPALFLLQGLLLASLLLWFAAGYAGKVPSLARSFARQIGLWVERPWVEVGIGILGGLGGWMVAMAVIFLVVGLVVLAGGEGLLPQEPPELVPLIVGLPLAVKVAIALTAGVVEELFFRGFLQPRVGIALSTGLFALAHLSYDQPFMLVGITVLSLIFAFLVRWRRSVVAAIVAHATFDAVQLLVVVPLALRFVPEPGGLGAEPEAIELFLAVLLAGRG